MSSMTGGIGWFEIGTDNPAAAEQFYGGLFGWSFAEDKGSGLPYREITTPSKDSVGGGLFAHGGKAPNYAVFYVVVDDVADTCRRAEAAGGKTLFPATTTDNGLVFAHLADPAGNQFGIYTPPPGKDS